MVADRNFASAPESVVVVIDLMNDEEPVISNTPAVQVFVEEGGPVMLFDANVTIIDADNRMEDRLVEILVVTLENPVTPEDQLIVNGSVLENFTTTFYCGESPECYEEFLLTLEYNNTNPEPGTFTRRRDFLVTVSGTLRLHSMLPF